MVPVMQKSLCFVEEVINEFRNLADDPQCAERRLEGTILSIAPRLLLPVPRYLFPDVRVATAEQLLNLVT